MRECPADSRPRWWNRRVLLGLHDEPPLKGALADKAGNRGEIDRAVPRHREHPASDARVEPEIVSPNLIHDGAANVLEMDMHDPVAEAHYQPVIVEPRPAAWPVSRSSPTSRPVVSNRREISSKVSVTIIR